MSNLKKKISNSGESWQTLLSVLLYAPVTLTLIISVVLVCISSNNSVVEIQAFLNVIFALLTGLLGALFTKKWDDLTTEQKVSTRADSAVRNLKLLLEQAISVEKRVTLFLNRLTEGENSDLDNYDVLINNFEETIHLQLLLEKNIVNSIEDWKDLVPKANIDQIFDEMRIFKENIAKTLAKLQDIDLAQKSIEPDEIIKIRNEIEELSNSVMEQRIGLIRLASDADLPSTSGSMLTGGTVILNKFLDFLSDGPTGPTGPQVYNVNPFDSLYDFDPKGSEIKFTRHNPLNDSKKRNEDQDNKDKDEDNNDKDNEN